MSISTNNSLKSQSIFSMIQGWCKILIALLFVLSGCTRLPEYARPAFHQPAGEKLSPYAGFSYRNLRQDDFQASSLTGVVTGYKHNIQARSCISIRPSADTKMRITNSNIGGKVQFIGSYRDVAFKAMFNPDCSWWNPDIPKQRIGYVLEHEQIHFGLTELKAREVTRLHRERLQRYLAIGDSFDAVRQELISELQTLTREALREELATHTEFDEQTSIRFSPAIQKEWLNKVVHELNKPLE